MCATSASISYSSDSVAYFSLPSADLQVFMARKAQCINKEKEVTKSSSFIVLKIKIFYLMCA